MKRDPTRHRPPRVGLATRMPAASVALAAVVVLVTACGGSPAADPRAPTASKRPTNAPSALGFAQCMRSDGVPNYPDPGRGGTLPKESPQQLGVSTSQFQAATRACDHLLPGGGATPNQAALQQVEAKGLAFAKCMRSHGIPLPDPDSTGRIPDPSSVGIDQGSPRFQAANQACARYRPPYMPSNAAYNAYARTQASSPAGSASNTDGEGVG